MSSLIPAAKMELPDASPDPSSASQESRAQYSAEETQSPAVLQRQVIYTATLRMRVENVDRSHDSVVKLLGRYRAYIASDNRTAYGESIENTMTIRVEREHFWELLNAIARQATYLDNKQVHAEDVTGAILDLQERLKSKQAAELQYREILKRAVKVEDILEVQKYLATIREEIELMQSQINRLTDQAAYSTLTIEMYKRGAGILPPEETFWGRAGEAVTKGWNLFLSFAVSMLSIWPVLLLGGVFFYGIFRLSKTRRSKPLIVAHQPENTGDPADKRNEKE